MVRDTSDGVPGSTAWADRLRSAHTRTEIHEWFGAPFLHPDVTASRQVADLQAAGLHVVTVDEWLGRQTFKDAEALVTYLALCPWDAEGFTMDEHLETLARLDSEAPIHVTQRRFRIHAAKASVL